MTVRVSATRNVGSEYVSRTVANMDIYVATTGDDVLGTGAVGAPYATIERALEDVPSVVDHVVHIHVAAGAYTEFPDVIDNVVTASGQIVIDGSAALADVTTGLAIAGGGWAVKLAGVAGVITEASGGLTPDAFRNKFIQFTDGPRAGLLATVAKNTATEITMGCYATAPAAGNAFKIVEPGVNITVAKDITVKGNVALVGIDFDNTSYRLTVEDGSKFVTACTTIECGGPGGFDEGVIVNDAAVVCGFGQSLSASDVAALQTTDESASAFDCLVLVYGELQAALVDGGVFTRRSAVVDKCASRDGYLYVEYPNANAYLSDIYRDSTNYGLYLRTKSEAFVQGLFVEAGSDAVYLSNGCTVHLESLDGTAANVSGHSVMVGRGAKVVAKKSACTLVGTSGQVGWVNGAASVAWPNQDVAVTDAVDATVVGV